MQTVSGTASSYTPQSVIYSNMNLASGTHTIKVVKKSGYWMVLDAFKIYNDSLLNDTNAGIIYTGSFSYSSNRGLGDYLNDVHQTQTNNDYFQYTFAGTGIDYIGVKNWDIGNQDVYIDGVLMQTVSGTASSYTPQTVLYSNRNLTNGTHTIKVVKKSGTWMVMDALKVYTSIDFNDNNSAITYTGSFSYSNNRGLGDYQNDVHQTQTNNDYFQFTFTGTGIDYIGVKNWDIGNQDVYIDGVLMQTVSGTASSYTAQAVLYSNRNLTNGTHTIKVVKKTGTWMVLDDLKVQF